MIKETEMLLATYLDGAGIFAWRENANEDGYVVVELPHSSTVETIDVAPWRIADAITDAVASGALNRPVEPAAPIDPSQLEDDNPSTE